MKATVVSCGWANGDGRKWNYCRKTTVKRYFSKGSNIFRIQTFFKSSKSLILKFVVNDVNTFGASATALTKHVLKNKFHNKLQMYSEDSWIILVSRCIVLAPWHKYLLRSSYLSWVSLQRTLFIFSGEPLRTAFFHLLSRLCCSKYYANLLCAVALLPYITLTFKTTEFSIVGVFSENDTEVCLQCCDLKGGWKVNEGVAQKETEVNDCCVPY